MSRHNRIPRDNKGDGTNSRASWWNRGYLVDNDDYELSPGNLGLGSRERRALSEENSKPYGMTNWILGAIARRGEAAGHPSEREEATRRARAQDSERVNRPLGRPLRLGDILRGE
jgi:hypothetical protein